MTKIPFFQILIEWDVSNFLQQYYLPNRIACQFNYDKGGVLNGKCVAFDIYGKLVTYSYYENGVQNGIWIENNGNETPNQTLSIGYYKQGKKNGLWLTCTPNFNNSISEYEDNPSFS